MEPQFAINVPTPSATGADARLSQDRVGCEWLGRGRLYPAVITNVNSDGTYRVTYDDGDVEDFVERERVVIGDEEEVRLWSPPPSFHTCMLQDDWYDDYNRLRQFTAAYMLRRCVTATVRKRWHCAFWRWRMTGEMTRDARRLRAQKMFAALEHLLVLR